MGLPFSLLKDEADRFALVGTSRLPGASSDLDGVLLTPQDKKHWIVGVLPLFKMSAITVGSMVVPFWD